MRSDLERFLFLPAARWARLRRLQLAGWRFQNPNTSIFVFVFEHHHRLSGRSPLGA
jgi:hypothetical protein